MDQDLRVKLVEMTDATFESFKQSSLDYYSKDAALAEGTSVEFAIEATTKQFEKMNSLGRQTPQ